MKQLSSNSESTSVDTIKAPQSVVHIKHSITLRQYKIWLCILQKYRDFYEAGEQYDEDGFYRFQKSELDKILGYETQKEEIRRDIITLRKEDIIISILEKGGEKAEEGMGFISRWRLTSKTIAIELPPFLKNVMKGLDQPRAMFQLLNWQIFNHFSGKYEAIIYKLCRDYVGAKNTPYMTIQEFRDYMGVKPNEYEQFMKLNEWVIKKPVEKINASAVSDISIKVQYRTEGRRKLGLYFVVSKKHQTTISFPELEQNEAFRFAKVHIEASMQMEYLALRKPEEIELCIERANEYGDGELTKGKEPNYGAIYRKAITEGWHIAYADKKAKKEVVEQAQQRAKKTEEQKKSSESLRDEKVKEEQIAREKSRLQFEALPESEKEKVRIAFESQLNEIMMKSWSRAKQKNPTSPEQEKEVKTMFFIFYKSQK